MGPYVAGFTSGIFRNIMDTKHYYFLSFAAAAMCAHSMTAICMSLFNRFVFLFRPHLKERLHNKLTLSLIVLTHLIAYGFYASTSFQIFMDHETMEQLVRNDTGNTLDKWLQEKSFTYIPEYDGSSRTFAFFALCFFLTMFFLLVGILIWFIVNVFIFKKTSKTLNELSAYLLITVLAQTGSCLAFFFIPAIIIVYCWTFAIDNSTNFVNAVLQLFILNGTTDMVLMLYFVKPYKIYCVNIVRRIFRLEKQVVIAQFETTQNLSSVL
uniref:Serpentine receptor class gamma n=1 Tax=Panagrellus redivivus TaxID=6233 RepID=A0A7E5A0N0_PANRE